MLEQLKKLYEPSGLDEQTLRYQKLITTFHQNFPHAEQYKLFSAPGRTEISGNHTDHNHGKVIAAAISLDSIAAAAPSGNNEVVLISEGFNKPFTVDLNSLDPSEKEQGSTAALIRGAASALKKSGYTIGGFNAAISGNVLIGSGLSSSASIEVLIGSIFNHLFNDGKIPEVEVAKAGQYAENIFFGKPCGLMDQLACTIGGVISINFYNPAEPLIQKIDFDFSGTGYRLIVLDTEADHSDLTADYAAIPLEMMQVAEYFGKNYLSEITLEQLLPEINSIRKTYGDRAVLRALHFLNENERVVKQFNALEQNDFSRFLNLVNESGSSSFKYLQNIYSASDVKAQGISLALALSEIFIRQKGSGACRVHGGGFAGTIQLFLPHRLINEYINYISGVFKKDSVKVLSVRNYGAVCLNNL